jgi:fluoroquinolone transport system permease protein
VGIALAAALFCLAGAGLVVRYDSINEFLLPSVLYAVVLTLPILGIFGFLPAAWYLPHPIQGPLSLMQIDRTPTAGLLAYAIGYPMLWIIAVYFWSRRALGRARNA